MVRIVWSNAAKEDLKEIKAYISKDSPEYAQIFTEHLFEKLKLLELFPKMGRSVPESDDLYDRELIFQNYRLVYKYNQDKVEIISIVHGSIRLKL